MSAESADRFGQLLARFDVPGPRYTSYPTADRFVEAFGPAEYRQALAHRASAGPVGGVLPLSIYVHVPFCESVCYYCACNKVVTRQHERAREYLAALEREIELHVQALGSGQPVSQLHLGGGSPTFLRDAELDRLMLALHRAFNLQPQAEVSIEVDPRTVDAARLQRLAGMGFNRISFGVQDFDPEVQKAVHRIQPFESVRELLLHARQIGFDSINADLIYGLPRQTEASFARTIQQIGGLRPERISVYAYAHLPSRFKPQRRIHEAELPPAAARVAMLRSAITGFQGMGYSHVGMDHFALPDDPLAVAKRQGRLHRNFQGYSTQADCDLVGLGVSAIGRIGACYSQNSKTLSEYYDALNQHQFPVARGLALNRDDLMRRTVIMALMCQGRVDFESVELAHLERMRDYFGSELARLQPLADEGLIEIERDAIQLTALGWYFVRAIAMVFDRYLQTDLKRAHFSRVI
jgi:oxygen-independent coproporphyrinogen III oxidase